MPQHRQTSSTPILQVDRVTKQFGAATALQGVSLDVREGEFLTLLGPSGCGKTTLIRIIAGFETPTTGDVRIDGKTIVSAPPYRRPLGMVFQNLALFPHLSVAQNIGYGLKMRRTPSAEIRRKVDDALAMVGLKDFGDRYIGQISGGQRQRVALARAIITEPRVLLLDEPLGALDLKIRRQMQTELKQIQEKLGTTFIFVTHDQEEALTMSDRVAVFRNGLIEQVSDPATVYERPASRFVAEFVGDTNFFEGVLEAGDGALPRVRCKELDHAFDLPDTRIAPGSQVGLSLRPQYVRLVAPEGGRVRARVTRRIYAGQNTRLLLRTETRDWLVDCAAHDGRGLPAEGDAVGLAWEEQHIAVVPLQAEP